MPLTVDLVGREAVIARLTLLPEGIRKSLERAVSREAIKVQGRVMAKLAGPVLTERTHHLHDSIHYEIASDASGVKATVGTDVVYAKIHEYGGTVTVREHLRHLTVAFGKPVETPRDILVRAHQATYPERSFLRSTLAEMAEEIRETLQDAVKDGLAEVMKS